MMDVIARLDTLSVELIRDIASLADKQDLLTLRQSSNTIANAMGEEFSTTFFTTRSHIYTSHSLQTLADLATQPKLLAKLKEVKLHLNQPRQIQRHTRRQAFTSNIDDDVVESADSDVRRDVNTGCALGFPDTSVADEKS